MYFQVWWSWHWTLISFVALGASIGYCLPVNVEFAVQKLSLLESLKMYWNVLHLQIRSSGWHHCMLEKIKCQKSRCRMWMWEMLKAKCSKLRQLKQLPDPRPDTLQYPLWVAGWSKTGDEIKCKTFPSRQSRHLSSILPHEMFLLMTWLISCGKFVSAVSVGV